MKQRQIPGTSTITSRLKREIDRNGRRNLSRFYRGEGLNHIAANRKRRGS